jgi:hypothetical protein
MSTYNENDHIKQMRRELKAARNFPSNTTPASRHLELIADALATGKPYAMLHEEPKHCAITMYAVLIGFYNRRTPQEPVEANNG